MAEVHEPKKRKFGMQAALVIDRPVVLVGMMGVGKTSIGKRLATCLGISFVDADDEIEKAAGLSITEIFAKFGEAYFRDGERRVIARLIEGAPKVIATGGGVVGDITGFAAHIIKRGCAFVQIPTTLLAQVDSSVGGKTAINSAAGKNLVGAFHQPALVLIDPELLSTLPIRQLAAGFAEVVKYGLIDDAAFFDFCVDNLDSFFAGSLDIRAQAIIRSVQSKARIVAADETERTGTRALLNLGHTFGHALEADTSFSDRLFHGEAVAAGMALAFRYSVRLGLCPAEDAERVSSLLKRAGLPTTLSEAGVSANGAALVDYMRHDKKMSGGTLPFLLARGIGQTFLSKDVALDDVAAFLDSEV